MNGRCDFCPRSGRLAHCHCERGHKVGVWVCAEKHEPDLNTIEIACRICYEGQPHRVRALYEEVDWWLRIYDLTSYRYLGDEYDFYDEA